MAAQGVGLNRNDPTGGAGEPLARRVNFEERMQTHEMSLSRHLLANDHDLDELVGALAQDLCTAEVRCSEARWNALEGRILDRLEAEEEFLSPAFDCAHPAEGASIHATHAKLRFRLADLRIFAQSCALKGEHARELLSLLRDLSSRKQAAVYPAADELDEGLASALVHRLGVVG